MKHLIAMALLLVTLPAWADDKDAFSAKPVPPNVMWILDSSGSMQNLICRDKESNECFVPPANSNDMRLVTVSSGVQICKSQLADSLGYSAATTYPYPDEDFTNGASELYDADEVFRMSHNDVWASSGSVTTFCNNFSDCKQKKRCIYSLQTFGYFYEPVGCTGVGDPSGTCGSSSGTVNNSYNPRMIGNLLRLYPPKFVQMRRAFKDVLGDADASDALARQRMALMQYATNNNGGTLIKKMNPPCNQLCYDDTCKSSFANNRASLENAVDSMRFDTSTPLGETLDDAACYFSNGNWPGGCSGDFTAGGGSNTAPVCLSCQANFALILTDGLPTEDTNADLSKATGATDPEGYILPAVAAYVYGNDLDPTMSGTQNLVTYAVGFGVTDASNANACAGVLDRAARAGNGKCLPANNKAQLKAALLSIIQEIDTRTRSFTAPAVQTTRAQGETNANLAVFKPFSSGPTWEGHLYSFKLFDEFLEGTQFSGGSAADAKEIFVLDALNNKVTFDTEGNLLSKPFWDAGLCLAGDLDGTSGAISPADIHNLDVSGCKRVADESNARARRMYTKFNPLVGRGGSTPDAFTVANVSSLQTLFGVTAEPAKKIIRWFRGFDMLDLATGQGTISGTTTINGLTYTKPLDRNLSTFNTTRGWWKLGDIYHSTPNLVIAPQEYVDATGVTGNKTSFDSYFESKKGRKRVILVGANDGFLHAFDAGSPTNTVAPILYSQGTGEELWAYAPSHLLPSMAASLSCPNDTTSACSVAKSYTYFVDGAAQVRDAYVGTGSDVATLANLKDTSKSTLWKSIMVVGDRDGGTKFTALDITDVENPKFLWEFPASDQLGNSGTKRGEPAGLTWSEVFPNPAPIIPVQFDGDGNAATTADVYLRWVVLLNGGFSRNQTAGRGVYMVDANTGELLWKFEYSNSGENAQMKYSFAAPVAGITWPPSANGVTVAIAVDTGGQVWKFDFSSPGIVSGGSLAQWTGQRIFTAATYSSAPDSNLTLTVGEYPYRPMFSVVAAAASRDFNDLWVYVGTGDRDLLGNPSLAHTSGVTLDSAVASVVCGKSPYNTSTYANRMYALKASKGRKVSGAPNIEADLTALNTSADGLVATLATNPDSYGWYLMLRPAEKINNPPDVFAKVVYFTSFEPTGACADSAPSAVDSCETPSGVGRLYALDFETGRPAIDFNGTGGTNFGTIAGVTTTSADTSKSLGSGIPTAAAVSVGIGNGRQSAAMLVSSSNDPTPTAQRANSPTTLVKKVLSLLVPRSLHDNFQGFGSNH